jgi:ABC-2 type transport system ATP-binding protein
MSEIEVRGLRKEYRVHERKAGLGAAVRSFFSRQYRTVTAVDGIDFSIEKGARVGFLGPNGAGKTTTLKMLAGLLHPTAGSVRVGGFVPSAREVAFLSRITLVMGQKQQLLWDLPPLETFDLNRAIYQVPRAQAAETIRELSELLELGDLVKKPTRELSLGERMKCELVAALVHRPMVLFLDEPTIGLDVSMQSTVRTFVKAYSERFGATLILTSHDMDDVSALCPRILVIDKGALSYDGALTGLVHEVRPEKRVHVSLEASCPREILEALAARSSAKLLSLEGASATFQVDKVRLAELTRSLLAELSVQDLEITSAPLEEVMSELFRRTKSARAPSEDEREP